MSKTDRVQKFIRDALLHILEPFLDKIPLVGPWLRGWLLKPLDRKFVTPASKALSANISEQMLSLMLRRAMQMLLEHAQEDGVEPKFQKWLYGAVHQVLKKLGEAPLTEEFKQQQPKRGSNLYQINTKSGENDDDDSGGGHARETAAGAYGKGLETNQAQDKTKEKWAAMREAFHEEVAGVLAQVVEQIDMEELKQEIDEELDKLELPSEEEVRGWLKQLSERLGLDLDVEKLTAKDMEETVGPLLEKKLEEEFPGWEEKLEEGFLPELNKYIEEQVWPVIEQEVNQKLDRLLGAGDDPKPQV